MSASIDRASQYETPSSQEPSPQKPASFNSTIRRIVSGNNEKLNGSTVTETAIPFEETGFWGMSQACLWKTTETPSNDTNIPSNTDGAARTGGRMVGYVCSRGTNFFIQDFAPEAVVPMHCSHTVDYFLMISGTMISVTEQGDEFIAKAGDVVVRQGNMHGWRNPGPEWARWVAVILDANPAIREGKSLNEGMKETALEG
ncbi:hypothetical protein NP233_g12774 [Leucocoprinus birnbaumii]|uniref:Cupin type-2 domain-containing protein n=1 Tax=Leucocoprinus birnbaumii TaxID=56174 RepID=A0AAD5VDY4_9AGAR|nr:hypothetical protein NP233_g12774 [Leucocoprinus birnbaumii]